MDQMLTKKLLAMFYPSHKDLNISHVVTTSLLDWDSMARRLYAPVVDFTWLP